MRIGIIGGGIMGLTLGYYLSKAGDKVTIFEKSHKLGGLAGYINLEGVNIDKYYHGILISDKSLLNLIDEVGLSNSLKFRDVKMAFFHEGKIFPMNNILDFMKFPPLNILDRIRLGYTIVNSLLIKDWAQLEEISVKKWLIKYSGKRTYTNIWKPLLKAKFDKNFNQIPATYVWSRIKRMRAPRRKGMSKTCMAYLVEGMKTLIDGLEKKIYKNNGKIYLKKPVEKILIENNRAIGLQTKDNTQYFDKIIVTVPTPYFIKLLPTQQDKYIKKLENIDYLHVICLLLKLKGPLSEFHSFHITDDKIPFTTIVETTNLIDPKYLNDSHIVYLPKYVREDNKFFKMSGNNICKYFLNYLKKMFPSFKEEMISEKVVLKERYVEPIHKVGSNFVPEIITPIKNLYLANTSQIYPALVNCESVTEFARVAAKEVLNQS